MILQMYHTIICEKVKIMDDLDEIYLTSSAD